MSVVADKERGSVGHVLGRAVSEKTAERLVWGERTPSDRLRLENEILSTMAGALAEEHRFPGERSAGAEGDREFLIDFAFRVVRFPDALESGSADETVNAYLVYVWRMAQNLIRREWCLVEALAQVLLARPSRVLSGVAACRVLKQAEEARLERDG